MTRPDAGVGGGSVRLWIDPPLLDETISSVLDRAAAFYAMDRAVLLEHLLPGYKPFGHTPDWDRPANRNHLQVFAESLGLEPGQAPGQEIHSYRELVAPLGRSAYCPLCFAEDLMHGRPPYFRWQWAGAYVTICPVHQAPLFSWKKMRRYQRVLPRSWMSAPSAEVMTDCAWLAEHLNLAKAGQIGDGAIRSALAKVVDFQEKYFDFSKGGSENWERRVGGYRYEVHDAIRLVTARDARDKEPVASLEAPLDGTQQLFRKVPDKDWLRLPRNAVTGFMKQRDVAWRRTVILAVAVRTR